MRECVRVCASAAQGGWLSFSVKTRKGCTCSAGKGGRAQKWRTCLRCGAVWTEEWTMAHVRWERKRVVCPDRKLNTTTGTRDEIWDWNALLWNNFLQIKRGDCKNPHREDMTPQKLKLKSYSICTQRWVRALYSTKIHLADDSRSGKERRVRI